MLQEAQLQGASLNGAQLRGASLKDAHLQAASFRSSELGPAELSATDLTGVFLWRANFNSAKLKGLLARDLNLAPEVPWSLDDYNNLIGRVEHVRDASLRLKAIERIKQTFGCKKRDNQLTPCDPKTALPQDAKDLTKAAVDKAVYARALAASLGDLVCDGDSNAVFILRRLLKYNHILRIGPQAAGLATRIQSQDCPVSSALNDDDRASLRTMVTDATLGLTLEKKKK